MIKFITEETTPAQLEFRDVQEDQNSKHLTFNDVEMNQFFVCADGHLCQKVSKNLYNTIADEHGKLCCDRFSCSTDYVIRRILPKITRIEF